MSPARGAPAPALTVVIAWCNRPELAATLRHNRDPFAEAGCEVVVVNCAGDARQLAQILAAAGVARSRPLHVPAPVFNKALALNLGAAAASSSRLFFLDADILLAPGTIAAAMERLRGRVYVTIDRVVETPPPGAAAAGPPLPLPSLPQAASAAGIDEIAYTIELSAPSGRRARIELNRLRLDEGARSAPGLVMLRRRHFLAVQGMSSDLEAWGWEDVDLLCRLELALGLRRARAGRVMHLSHGDSLRAGDGGLASEQRNQALCLLRYRAGDYLGSYADDLVRFRGHLEAPTGGHCRAGEPAP